MSSVDEFQKFVNWANKSAKRGEPELDQMALKPNAQPIEDMDHEVVALSATEEVEQDVAPPIVEKKEKKPHVPSALRRVVNLRHCGVCGKKMNSDACAKAHFKSPTHIRKVEIWLLNHKAEQALKADREAQRVRKAEKDAAKKIKVVRSNDEVVAKPKRDHAIVLPSIQRSNENDKPKFDNKTKFDTPMPSVSRNPILQGTYYEPILSNNVRNWRSSTMVSEVARSKPSPAKTVQAKFGKEVKRTCLNATSPALNMSSSKPRKTILDIKVKKRVYVAPPPEVPCSMVWPGNCYEPTSNDSFRTQMPDETPAPSAGPSAKAEPIAKPEPRAKVWPDNSFGPILDNKFETCEYVADALPPPVPSTQVWPGNCYTTILDGDSERPGHSQMGPQIWPGKDYEPLFDESVRQKFYAVAADAPNSSRNGRKLKPDKEEKQKSNDTSSSVPIVTYPPMWGNADNVPVFEIDPNEIYDPLSIPVWHGNYYEPLLDPQVSDLFIDEPELMNDMPFQDSNSEPPPSMLVRSGFPTNGTLCDSPPPPEDPPHPFTFNRAVGTDPRHDPEKDKAPFRQHDIWGLDFDNAFWRSLI